MVAHGGTPPAQGGAVPDWRRFPPLDLPPALAHSLAAFAEYGYHGTTVREIARRMGKTVPAIYHHHASKQAILAALAQRSIDLLLDRVELALADAGDDPVDRLRNLVECIVLYMAHHRELGFLSGEIRSLEGENRITYIAGRDRLEALVHEVLAAGAATGTFEVPHRAEAVRALMAMSFGVSLWYRPDGPLSPEVIAERYGGIALRAVGVGPGGTGGDRG